jgi:DNA-binding SARP family transcriptional activator
MKHKVQNTYSAHPPLTVYTLGRFAVYRGDTAIADSAWQRQKAKKLFKLLLLAPQRQLLKEQVLELLWPEKTPEAATNNLHRTLFILRRVLQPDLENAAQSPYLLFKDDCLMLNPDSIAWVDAETFERLSQLGRQEQHNPKHYRMALELYKGAFLPEDLYEDWTADRRNALQKSYIDMLKHLAVYYAESSSYQQAIDCLHTLLQIEPTDEGVQRALMKLYAQTGERHAALRLYRHSSEIVRAEFGVEPSTETTALYEAILEEALPAGVASLALPGRAEPLQSTADNSSLGVLVGREPELQELTECLRQAQHGHGSVVFIAGEQGVGKSRLGDELVAYAQRSHIRILKGAVFEGEGQLLYALFVGAIRSGLTPQILERVRYRLGPLITDLARLLPEIAQGLPAKHHRPEPELGRLDIELGSQERQRLFDAIAATFTSFAQTSPLLVIFDNLHIAGESSLQLLHYLARQIAHQRILFVCLVDQDKIQRGQPITLILSELQRNHLARRVNLERLSPDQVTILCAHLLDASVYESTIPAKVYELTEGNPFFIRELILSLTRSGKIERRDNAWQLLPEAMSIIPSSVQEIIGTRLGQLSNEAYRLLGVAAVIGNEFGVQMLQIATKWDPGKLFDALDELRAEALVRSIDTTYRFQHAMIRQVVYHELSAERRAWMHQQVAQALETLVTSQSDEHANLLAFHYEHAGSYLAAVQYQIRAGDWARSAHALREALAHYDRAIELGRQFPDAIDRATTISLLERRSQTYLALSNFDSAIEDLEQLLKTYQNADQQRMVGATLYRIGFAHYWAHRLMKATLYLDRALYLAETLDYSELRNRALRLRDILNSTQGKIADSPTAEIDLPGDAAQLPQFQAEELWGYAMLAHLRYDFAQALQRAQACIAAGTARSNTFLALGGYFILGMSQASLADYQEALNSLLGALKISETAGDRFWRARLLNTIGWVYRDLFSLDMALQYDQASLELARSNTPRLTEAEGNALANLATVCWLMGRYDLARAYMNEGLALSLNEPFMRWRYSTRLVIMQGRLALIDGDLAAAWEATEKSLDLARNTKSRKNIARSCLLRSKVQLAKGDTGGARAAVRHALSISQKLQTLGLTWTCHLALAELEQADHDEDEAYLHYAAALEIVEQIAGRLTDPTLHERFLAAGPMRKLLLQKRAHASV